LRTSVTFTSLSSCGIETAIGTTRLSLNAGQSMQVTVSYPLPPDACLGMYTVSITANSGGRKSASTAAPSASAYLTVQ
jgi:uncharacterized membrane protein